MLTPRQKYEVCRVKSGVAYFPFIDSPRSYIAVSTRNGNILVKWGGGSEQQITPNKNVDATVVGIAPVDHIYSANYTGDVQVIFRLGLSDVYSISFGWSYNDGGTYILNIQDIKAFFAQFPNLYSVNFDIYSYTGYVTVIKGDFSQLPNSVERVCFQNWEVKNRGVDQWLNFTNYSLDSKLKHFDYVGGITNHGLKVIGDISKIPPLCTFFKLPFVEGGSAITYTAGKVWASTFDTLSIALALTTTELDNLLIDMSNSITSTGAGIIELVGWRSPTSDAAVAYLQGLGRTVNIQRIATSKDYILDSSVTFRMDFQNNYDVYSNSLIDITSGNGVGSTGNLPTFTLSGRKAGEYCAVFNGSQSIKTTTNLPVNSDKVTIAFWMKTTHTGLVVIAEMSPDFNTNNAFGSFINNISANKIDISDHTTSPSGYNIGYSAVNINNGNWLHVVVTIDRNLGVAQNQIYINGSLSYTQHASYVANLAGNFLNNILFIGQRGGSTIGFNGSLTKLKIYNYPFTASEVSNLYNSEL